MTTIRYNPLTYSDKLIESGMKTETAKIIAQHEAEFASSVNSESFATKDDIKDLRSDIKILIAEIKSLENRMTIKFGAIMLIGVGLLNFLQKHT